MKKETVKEVTVKDVAIDASDLRDMPPIDLACKILTVIALNYLEFGACEYILKQIIMIRKLPDHDEQRERLTKLLLQL